MLISRTCGSRPLYSVPACALRRRFAKACNNLARTWSALQGGRQTGQTEGRRDFVCGEATKVPHEAHRIVSRLGQRMWSRRV